MRQVAWIILLVLVGCGGDAAGRMPTSIAVSPIARATTAPSALMVGQTGILPDGEMVTVRATEIPLVAPRNASSGRDYLGADVEWCAGPHPEGGSVSTTGFDFQLVLTDNTRDGPDLGHRDSPFVNTTLTPNDCNRGWVTFSVDSWTRVAAVTTHALRWNVHG